MDPQDWHFQEGLETPEEYRLFECFTLYQVICPKSDVWHLLSSQHRRTKADLVTLAHHKAWGTRADARRAELGPIDPEGNARAARDAGVDLARSIIAEIATARALNRLPPNCSDEERIILREALKQPRLAAAAQVAGPLAPLPDEVELSEDEKIRWFAMLQRNIK